MVKIKQDDKPLRRLSQAEAIETLAESVVTLASLLFWLTHHYKGPKPYPPYETDMESAAEEAGLDAEVVLCKLRGVWPGYKLAKGLKRRRTKNIPKINTK